MDDHERYLAAYREGWKTGYATGYQEGREDGIFGDRERVAPDVLSDQDDWRTPVEMPSPAHHCNCKGVT